MLKNNLYLRSGTAAIAAALALHFTPALAQDAAAPPAAADAPATVSDPLAASPAPAEPEIAPAPTDTTVESAAPVASARQAAPAVKKRAPASRANSASAIGPEPSPALAPATAPAAPVAPEPAPVADLAALDAPVAPPPPEPNAAAILSDDSAQLAFGGALTLLVLGGGALAFSRRRRRAETDDQMMVVPPVAPRPEPIPARPERAMFDWDRAHSPVAAASAPAPAMQGTWTERALRGPTPDNPSVSLKKRLKRAAFFEQRERAAAVGAAKPVPPRAGLPGDTAVTPSRPATRHDSFARILQPA